MAKKRPKYEEFKENHLELYRKVVDGIKRLRSNKVPHLPSRPGLDWWDDVLFLTLSEEYMEKRVREQIIRGLLEEQDISWKND